MRSATASRAVSIRIGTRLPAPRSRRQTSRPSMSGMPTSSTTASGTRGRGLRERLLAALGHLHLVAGQRQRAAQGVAHGAVVVDDEDSHRRPFCRRIRRSANGSYAALMRKNSSRNGHIRLRWWDSSSGRRRPARTGRTQDASLDSVAFARHGCCAHCADRGLERHDVRRRAHRHEADQGQRDHEPEDPQRRRQEHRPGAQQRRHREDRRERRHGPSDQGRIGRQCRPRQRLRQRSEDPRPARSATATSPTTPSRARRSAQARSAATDVQPTTPRCSSKIADGSIVAADIKDGEVVKGNARMLATAVTLPDGAGQTALLSTPGLGALRASCAAGVTTTQWQNTGTRPWPWSIRSCSPARLPRTQDANVAGGGVATSPPTRAPAASSRSCGRRASTAVAATG